MVKVTIIRNSIGKILSFKLAGHADSGPHGHDLVCAGVSAVSFGAVNAVYELVKVTLDVDQADDGGYLSCSVPSITDEQIYERVQLLLEGMLISLRTIELDYGKYIKVIDRGGGSDDVTS